MKAGIICIFSVICGSMPVNPSDAQIQTIPSGLKILFTRPVESWNEALPVGNGRLGAMVFGGIENERLQLSDTRRSDP